MTLGPEARKSRRQLVAAAGTAAVAGFAVGHFRLPLRARLALAGQSLQPPIDTLEAYREQRLDSFTGSHLQADTVMLGDSMTEYGDWTELLPGGTVLNRGIRGDTTADVLARLDEALSHGAQRLFLLVGINDIIKGVPVAQAAENVEAILVRAQAAVPNVTAQSVLPVASPLEIQRINPQVKALNHLVSEAAQRAGAGYIDLWPSISPGGTLAAESAFDGLHPSPMAYLRWRDALLAAETGA